MDVLSVSHNGQLISFSAGMMAYGFWSDMNLFSQDFAWLGSGRYNAAMIRTLISHRSDVSTVYDISTHFAGLTHKHCICENFRFLVHCSVVHAYIYCRSFEVELSYVPMEEPTAILEKRERCFSR